MSKPRILLQIDPDKHASSFDAVVAVDSDVDHLLQYHNVEPDEVVGLVHGTIFTRSPDELKNTAIFIGGTDVNGGVALLKAVTNTFFGPMRVSVMLDANGANTTAAAAVLAVAEHVDLSETTVAVLGATGSVGQRVVRLLARQGSTVRIGSRGLDRAESVASAVREQVSGASLQPAETSDEDGVLAALKGADVVVAAGAAGIELLPASVLSKTSGLKVAVDLNAVPPLGITGIEVTDRAALRNGVISYGAIGVGGRKMKIHKAAIRKLFESNSNVLDAEEIFDVGSSL
jgi:NADPH:quinone reductase-like Zn-dependent oxidoreductase